MLYSKFYTKALILTLLLLLNASTSSAQTKKFGDVSVEDFTAYDSEYDSSMSAVILFNKGVAEFDSDYKCLFEFHTRIKILTDEGFEYGDIQIPMYESSDQDVYNIKATTYTLLADGTIKENKVGKKEIFKEEIRKGLEVKKFTMPDLARGVIIEYSYHKIMGSPFNLPDWKFHEYVPVEWSEYTMKIPKTLMYKMIFKGRDSLYINEVSKMNQQLYLAKRNLPAVEDLPYLINRNDHISEVITQLDAIRIPRAMPQDFFKSWEKISSELNDRDDFGKQKLNGQIKDQLKFLVSDQMSDLEKVEAVYNYLVNNITWNNRYRLTSEKGIRDTFKDLKGSTGDINLLLVEMLREVGVGISPALISTRTNGTVLTDYPLINQFNMLVAVVELENTAFVIDASSGRRAFTVLHPKILYRNAFVIRKDDSYGWLTSYPLDKSHERISLTYTISDSSNISVDMAGNVKGEYAEEIRQNVNLFNPNEYWENSYKDLPGLSVDSSLFNNVELFTGSVSYTTNFSFDTEQSISTQNETIYLQPFLFLNEDENPFKKRTRDLPVEFAYPFSKQHIITIKIPEEYVIDELPESFMHVLEDKNGVFRFMVTQNGNTLTLVSSFDIKSVYFSPDKYQDVKDLFQKRVEAVNAVVVLKKKT